MVGRHCWWVWGCLDIDLLGLVFGAGWRVLGSTLGFDCVKFSVVTCGWAALLMVCAFEAFCCTSCWVVWAVLGLAGFRGYLWGWYNIEFL